MVRKSDRYDIAAITLLFVVFLFSGIRAAVLSLTHDEALTYFVQLGRSFGDIFAFSGPMMPNNHFFNTILVKILTGLFGPSELVIRMPALIGHALYLVGVYKIGRLFLQRWLFLIGLALLTLHPFTMDFFSCARGYGLGLGFFVLGLYFFFKAVVGPKADKSAGNTFLAVSLAALAVFSQLIFTGAFAAMAAIVVFLELRRLFRLMKKTPSDSLFIKEFLKKIALPVGPGIFFLAAVYSGPVQKMLEVPGAFTSGGRSGTQGFWQETVRSLIDVSLYEKTYLLARIISAAVPALIVVLAGVALLVLGARFFRKEVFGAADKFLSASLAMLSAASLAIVAQHVILKKEYPVERWAIFLIPLFLIFVISLWNCLRRLPPRPLRVGADIFFSSLAALFLVHFLACANTTHFYNWSYDASTKDMVGEIAALNDGKDLPDGSVRLGVDWLFEPSTNYYIVTKKLASLGRVDRRGPDGYFDYYLLLPEDKEVIGKFRLETIREYPVSGAILARPSGNGDTYEALCARGISLAQQDDAEGAVLNLSRAIEQEPDRADAYQLRGQVVGMKGDRPRAIEDFTKALAIDPGLAAAFRNRGILYLADEKNDLAIEDFTRAIVLNPNYALAYHDRAAAYQQSGEKEKAREDLNKARAMGFPEDPELEASLSSRTFVGT